MDDPNITIEEYIRLEEEKAQRHGRTFNWQTATFGKLERYEDEDDCFTDFKTEFQAIVFDNTLTADTTLLCEPTVSPPNENKIGFRISLDESNDEDYMDSENDEILKPSSPKPTVDYLDDLDFFNDFENEFPGIVYNDGLTSKPDLKIKPFVSSKRVNKFETSLSEYDKDNVLHFNDLFNIIYPDELKSEKDNDDNDIDIIECSKGNEITHWLNGISETNMAPLPAADQRHPWLRYQIEEYTEGIRHSYEQRLEMIWSRPVNRVHVLDFEGLTPEMRQDLAGATGVRESRLEETIWDPSTFGPRVHSGVS
ncbi:hypothetical protein Tco_1554616 [Tanacetum coccineum]